MDSHIQTILQTELPLAVKSMAQFLKKNKVIGLDSFLDLRDKLGDKLTNELSLDISTFAFLLSQFPGLWAELFLNEHIHTRYTDIELGNHIYAFNHLLNTHLQKNKNHQIFYKMAEIQIKQYLLQVMKRIVHVFNYCKKRLREKVESINILDSKDIYTNKYIIFKLLKEFSSECLNDCKSYIIPLFERVDCSTFKKFVKWVVKKHEVLSLKINLPIEAWVVYKDKMTKQELQKAWVDFITNVSINQKISYTEAIRSDGKQGVLIVKRTGQIEDQSKNSKTLLFSDQYDSVAVMNCALMTKKWKSKVNSNELRKIEVQKHQKVQDLLERQSQISEKLVNQMQIATGYEFGVENVGQALGSCIANFKQYDSIQSFLEEFSKQVLVSGALGILCHRIPIVGKLLVIGGFSEELFKIVFSKYKTFKHKIVNIAKMTITVGLTLTGGLVGLTIGQILIPIYIVGPLVGATAGGYFTTKWLNKADDLLQDRRLNNIYKGLVMQMNHDGWFKHSDQLLHLFQIKASYFDKTVPKLNTSDDKSLWMTALCFYILSFYQSRKDEQQMNQKINDGTLEKQLEQKKKQVENQIKKQEQHKPKGILNPNSIGRIKLQPQKQPQAQPQKQPQPHAQPQNKKHHGSKLQDCGHHHKNNKMINDDLEKCLYYLEDRNFKLVDHLQALTDLMIKALAL